MFIFLPNGLMSLLCFSWLIDGKIRSYVSFTEPAGRLEPESRVLGE